VLSDVRACYVESHIRNFREPERERGKGEIDIDIICSCVYVGRYRDPMKFTEDLSKLLVVNNVRESLVCMCSACTCANA
jgi:hypothetical protein